MRFPTTLWAQLSSAGRGDPLALEDFCKRYRGPVFQFFLRKGFQREDSDDLTQEVFRHLLEKNLLARADRERGRFRCLLLAVASYLASDEVRRRNSAKRGGGVRHVHDSNLLDLVAGPAIPDEDFDRAWAENLLGLALERYRLECEKSGKPYFAVFRSFLKHQDSKKTAEETGLAPHLIKKYVYRSRVRLRQLVREEIERYSSTCEEFRQDVREVFDILRL